MTPENITIFKDVLYPTIDLVLKIVVGGFLLFYLHQRSQKYNSKEKMSDVYFSLVDCDEVIFNFVSRRPFLMHFEWTPFRKGSDKVYEAYYEALEECLGKRTTAQIDADMAFRRLTLEARKWEFLIGKKEYATYFSSFRSDVHTFFRLPIAGNLSPGEISKTIKFDIKETKSNILTLAEHFEANLITKNELKNKIIEELLPVSNEIVKIAYKQSQRLTAPHFDRMVEYINWY